MAKYVLNYSGLDEDFKHLGFTSAGKRAGFVEDIVIRSTFPQRVFGLIVVYSDNDSDIYVFDNINCIIDVVNNKWSTFWLLEFYSYEEAYKYALDLKEENPLCYNRKKQ